MRNCVNKMVEGVKCYFEALLLLGVLPTVFLSVSQCTIDNLTVKC